MGTKRHRQPDAPPRNAGIAAMRVLRNVGQLLSRCQICERVWGRSAVVTSRTLDTHVSRVRRKLGFIPENGWRLAAKYGHGYRLQQLGAAPSSHQPP